MQAIIQLLLLAYTMEGIKADDVVLMVSKENGCSVLRCLAPQQHQAKRATDVKKRMERQLGSYRADVHVQPERVFQGTESHAMYTVVVTVMPETPTV